MLFFIFLKAFGLIPAFVIATLAVLVELSVAVYALVQFFRKESSKS